MSPRETGWNDEEQEHHGVADTNTWRVRLAEHRCTTCIFRPGNLMRLEPGRVKDMVEDCVEEGRHVVCHQTLAHNGKRLPGAVCRGFEQHPRGADASDAVRWLRGTGLVTLVNTDTGALTDADYTRLPPYAED